MKYDVDITGDMFVLPSCNSHVLSFCLDLQLLGAGQSNLKMASNHSEVGHFTYRAAGLIYII